MNWISVKERLPESGKTVLLLFKNIESERGITLGLYSSTSGDFRRDDGTILRKLDHWRIDGVTHWAELPELPPKEDICARCHG